MKEKRARKSESRHVASVLLRLDRGEAGEGSSEGHRSGTKEQHRLDTPPGMTICQRTCRTS